MGKNETAQQLTRELATPTHVEVSENTPRRGDRLEKLYTDYDLTPERVKERLEEIKDKLKAGESQFDFHDSLYVTPSDPLPMIEGALWPGEDGNIEGKKLLTVAGGGELPLMFSNLGAESVDSFDLSMPGAFMTEAKYAAASILSYEEYLDTFDTSRNEDGKQFHCLIRETHYSKIKPLLSAQAQTYFDTIFSPGMEDLMVIGRANNTSRLYRRASLHDINRFYNTHTVSTLDEESYDHLRKVAQEPGDFFLKSLTDFDQDRIQKYDYIFISNIGFTLDIQTEIIKGLLQKGANRIGFTIGKDEKGIKESETITIDEDGNIVDEETEEETAPVLEYEGTPLIPNTNVTINGLTLKIVLQDILFSKGRIPLYAEALDKDNTDTPQKVE